MSWYPKEMRRVDILVPGNMKENVVREMKESGMVELIDAKHSGLENGNITDNYPRISELMHLIEEALDSFNIFKEEKPDAPEKISVREEGADKLIMDVEKKLPVIEKIISLNDELKALEERRSNLEEVRKMLPLLESLELDPKSLSGHEFVSVFLGKISGDEVENVRKGLEKLKTEYFMKTKDIGGDVMLVMTASKKSDEETKKVLNLAGFEPFGIPEEIADADLKTATDKIKKEFSDISGKESGIKENLSGLLKEKHGLLVLLELLEIEKKLEESEMMFGKTKQTNLISGWVPASKFDEFEKMVSRSSNNAYNLKSREPTPDENPPTVIENNGVVRGLEVITENYGLPSYGELDPTKFISLTFPFIFGMMFGDIGHGILLLIAGLVMSKKMPGKGAKNFGRTLALCGLAATFFGFMYGAAFGLTHENTPWMLQPLWMEPLAGGGENITYFIKFSVTLAVVVLSLGCILNIINKGRHSLLHAFFHPWGVLGLWVLLAGYNMFLKYGINFITLTIMGVLGDQAALSTIFPDLILLVIPVVLVPFGEILLEKKPLVVGLYGAMEIVQTFLVNTISYVRIVILAVVHGALMLMVLKIMEMAIAGLSGVGGSVLAVVIFTFGNIAVFVMEAMISLVQTIRLHFYEFFSKFYSSGGRGFVPFRAERRYTTRK